LLWSFPSLASWESINLALEVELDDIYPLDSIIQLLFSVTSRQVEVPVLAQPIRIYVGYTFFLPAIQGLVW
jgi:hypothetical protein